MEYCAGYNSRKLVIRRSGTARQALITAASVGQAVNDEADATESLQRAAVPFTIIPERGREEIQTYAGSVR